MILDKKQMTEEDIKLQFITPAIVEKRTLERIATETKVTDGQPQGELRCLWSAQESLSRGTLFPERRNRPRPCGDNREAGRGEIRRGSLSCRIRSVFPR